MKENIFIDSTSMDQTPVNIPTVQYGNVEVKNINDAIQAYITTLSNSLDRLLEYGSYWVTNIAPFIIDAIYPQDAYGNNNTWNKINGILRLEKLATFVQMNSDTWDIEYITRGRPQISGTNTPWALDPGVISHGGMSQAGMVNAWRYVADKLWVSDRQLTVEDYLQYLEENPFPEDYSLLDAGAFILTNGSNAREEWGPRTSGLMSVNVIALPSSEFTEIIDKQNSVTDGTIYKKFALSNNIDTSQFTPKHQAVHYLLGRINIQIKEAIRDL